MSNSTNSSSCQHRLIGVSLPGGSTVSYKYDAFGRRIEKTVDSHTTEFLWQGERLIAESDDNRYRSYIYEPDSFRPLAMLDGEGPRKATPFYYQLDHLGTPQELTDYSGEIMWSAKYRAYGNIAALDVKEIDNPLRFQRQYESGSSQKVSGNSRTVTKFGVVRAAVSSARLCDCFNDQRYS
ncbi:Rhs-family protein [Pseudomonas chlororaphis]|uniref:Rhs-family protein n=1 Tax=Pseudomonas chlororaphis TaxID=587753 RepID=A0A3G7TYH7_9PSED|nr:Rhs-family protein [Pseudomonas chlororaphis]